MIINIDSKIQKRFKRPLETIQENQAISYHVQEITRHIAENRDCLLVTTPASLKTQILFAVAKMNPGEKINRIVLPENRTYLYYDDSSPHICIQSYDRYLLETNKQCAALLVDEGERIDDPIEGELIESLLIESDPGSPLVLAINARTNVDDVAKWLTKVRQRKCMVIRAQCPKKIFPTYFTNNGEWLPLLDKKKLNRKVKNHLKQIKKPISMKSIFFHCIDLVHAHDLLPVIIILPEITTMIDLWNKYPEKEFTPGQYMTAPQIVRILDQHPELKDNPFVLKMLKKRVGICFNDLVWLQLLENVYSLGAIDIILATPETIKRLYCSVKSLILMGHPEHNAKNTDISLALWYDQLLMRTGYQDIFGEKSNKIQTIFCILTDSPEISPVHVKDYLDPGSFSLQSHFKWRLSSITGRISRNRSVQDDLNKSFLVAIQGACNNVLFHDSIMEIQAEFPHAKCLPVNAMSFLNSIRIKWTNELTQDNKRSKVKLNQGLETKYQTTQFLLDCLPCNDCNHRIICHQRGSKRFRELVDLFYAYQADKTNAHLMLETIVPNFYNLLQQLEWIDINNDMTPKGQLAYQMGPTVNPLLIECFFNYHIPENNHRLYAAILAGFLPDEWSFPTHIDLRYPAISEIYHKFRPYLREAATKMLALGLHPHIPDYQLSCIYYSLTSTDDRLILMEQSNLNQMNANSFIDHVNREFQKFRTLYKNIGVS